MIGDLIRRIVCTRKSEIGAGVVVTAAVQVPPDHHGLGSVVGDARKKRDQPASDLLNVPGKPCGCDSACSGHMPTERPGG